MTKSSVLVVKMSSKPSSEAAVLVTTIIDTTLRMFVPTTAAILLGVWLDQALGTTLWLTLAMAMIGCVISFSLIILQIRNIGNK